MYYEKTSVNEEKREPWIDVLKGIGVILVVIGHISLDNGISNWIYTFHMPMFFALSGYLWSRSAKNTGIKEFLLKRIKTILWPFILFRILLVVYWIVVESHFRSLDLGPIWFLIVLFVVEIVAFFLLIGRKDSLPFNAAVIVALAVAWFAWKMMLPENILCSWILRCINGLLWYIVGHFIGLNYAKKTFGGGYPKIFSAFHIICLVYRDNHSESGGIHVEQCVWEKLYRVFNRQSNGFIIDCTAM